jgi:FixJ family two-component response regulator
MTTAQQSRTALIDVSLRAPSLPQDGGLTPRQRDILGHIARGRSNKQIAFALGISEITVKLHRGNLMRKMNAVSVGDIVRAWEALPPTLRERETT